MASLTGFATVAVRPRAADEHDHPAGSFRLIASGQIKNTNDC